MSEKELKNEVRGDMKDLKKKIESMVRWYIGFSFSVILMLSGWIGYLAKEEAVVRRQMESLKADFGLELLITASQHQTAIGFKELVSKYYPTRGGGETK